MSKGGMLFIPQSGQAQEDIRRVLDSTNKIQTLGTAASNWKLWLMSLLRPWALPLVLPVVGLAAGRPLLSLFIQYLSPQLQALHL